MWFTMNLNGHSAFRSESPKKWVRSISGYEIQVPAVFGTWDTPRWSRRQGKRSERTGDERCPSPILRCRIADFLEFRWRFAQLFIYKKINYHISFHFQSGGSYE
jgi:hypothetical protein